MDPRGLPSTDFAKLNKNRAFLQLSTALLLIFFLIKPEPRESISHGSILTLASVSQPLTWMDFPSFSSMGIKSQRNSHTVSLFHVAHQSLCTHIWDQDKFIMFFLQLFTYQNICCLQLWFSLLQTLVSLLLIRHSVSKIGRTSHFLLG